MTQPPRRSAADLRAARRAPSFRTWFIAALELAGAFLLARLVIGHEVAGTSPPEHHGMHVMPAAGAHWGWVEFVAVGISLAAVAWWLLLRHRIAAAVAAVGLVTLVSSPTVRMLAVQSHLIAMVGLEVLLVIAPLLTLFALCPRKRSRPREPHRGATGLTVAAAVVFAGCLVVTHVPAVHRIYMAEGAVPVWVTMTALVVGVAYWPMVIRTAGWVPSRIRLMALLGAQEVAAFIALLSLFGAWGAMAQPGADSPLGISASWDQRLGGLFMLATCAAVTLPLARRLRTTG